jgi:hypothetical protein
MRTLVAIAVVVALGACSHNRVDHEVGAICRVDGDCVERCESGGDFPDGFCTITCVDDRDCPSDTLCANTHGGVCVFGCRDSRDCDFLGPRYSCREKKDFANLSVLVCMGG